MTDRPSGTRPHCTLPCRSWAHDVLPCRALHSTLPCGDPLWDTLLNPAPRCLVEQVPTFPCSTSYQTQQCPKEQSSWTKPSCAPPTLSCPGGRRGGCYQMHSAANFLPFFLLPHALNMLCMIKCGWSANTSRTMYHPMSPLRTWGTEKILSSHTAHAHCKVDSPSLIIHYSSDGQLWLPPTYVRALPSQWGGVCKLQSLVNWNMVCTSIYVHRSTGLHIKLVRVKFYFFSPFTLVLHMEYNSQSCAFGIMVYIQSKEKLSSPTLFCPFSFLCFSHLVSSPVPLLSL